MVGSIRVPPRFAALAHHFTAQDITVGGVSGGRTSALMHVLALLANPDDTLYQGGYANTGKEHEGTLTFLDRLQKATGRPLRWLEFRKPATFGARPREARYATVDHATASRNGQPFVDFLETLAEFRATHKGEGPVAPNPVQRICTAYMKVKPMAQYSLSIAPSGFDKFIGLRADEPRRVARISAADTSTVTHRTPLADAGITKADVLAFWAAQDFDLEIPEYLGNCNKCFLKDEADIAQSYWEEPGDGQWWLDIQDRFGNFRGNRNAPMRLVFAEAAVRMTIIRPAVAAGQAPELPPGFDPRRFTLLVRQERKRLVEGPTGFSCACEASQAFVDE